MGHGVSLFGMVVFSVAAGWQLVQTVAVFEDSGERLRRLWAAEYRIRACAEEGALDLNLRDGARWIADLPGVRGVDVEMAVRGLRQDLAARGFSIDGHEGVRCVDRDLPGYEALPHREEGEGHPRRWPNWIARLARRP